MDIIQRYCSKCHAALPLTRKHSYCFSCKKHYNATHKTLSAEERHIQDTERLLENTLLVLHPTMGTCWQWTGPLYLGYGRCSYKGKNQGAYRASYIHFKGAIPPNLTLDHLCRNRACINPSHLEPVTTGENVLRGVSFTAQEAKQTHCKYGHELVGHGIYWEGNKRKCRLCRYRREAERRKRNKSMQ